jgi:hypothetical protein
MRRLLLILGIILSMGGSAAWALLGANMGWTKTRVQEKSIDPVTDIEGIVWKDQFVPGIDFLVGMDTVGMILIVGGLLGRKETNGTHTKRP